MIGLFLAPTSNEPLWWNNIPLLYKLLAGMRFLSLIIAQETDLWWHVEFGQVCLFSWVFSFCFFFPFWCVFFYFLLNLFSLFIILIFLICFSTFLISFFNFFVFILLFLCFQKNFCFYFQVTMSNDFVAISANEECYIVNYMLLNTLVRGPLLRWGWPSTFWLAQRWLWKSERSGASLKFFKFTVLRSWINPTSRSYLRWLPPRTNIFSSCNMWAESTYFTILRTIAAGLRRKSKPCSCNWYQQYSTATRGESCTRTRSQKTYLCMVS